MVDCTKNLYEILGVSLHASQGEIKAAYKKLARCYHPDINKTQEAEITFKLLNNAYDVLYNPEKRKNYDSILKISNAQIIKVEEETNVEIKIPNSDSIIKEIKITKEEANKGASRTVNILNRQKCPKCMGKKFINGLKCSFCLGEGEKKVHKKIDIAIGKGTKNNSFIYVGKVNTSALYDRELFLKIIIEPSLKLNFEGDNIFVKVEIPIYDAILGAQKEINVDTMGICSLIIPPLTPPGSKIPIETEFKGANFYAFIDVIFPKSLSNEEKNLYYKLRSLEKEHDCKNQGNI